MDTLVSILLYMHVISGSGSYTAQQLNNFVTINATEISIIKTTPGQVDMIMSAYEPMAIVIIDGTIG